MADDAAFIEALDAYKQAVYDAGYEGGFTPGGIKAMNAARARVLALYEQRDAKHAERQGEEGQVTRVLLEGRAGPDEVTITLPCADSYAVGDRVRVTKVEEGQ